jgi:hypothetical protein
LWRPNPDLEENLQQLNNRFAIAVEKPIVAGATKAFGQHMLKQQPEKISTWQGAGFYCAVVVRVTKGHLSIFAT